MKRAPLVLLPILLGLLAATAARSASAQSAPVAGDPPPSTPPADPPVPPVKPPPREEITEVRVIGDKADSFRRIPGAGQKIGEKDIERAQPYDAAEMLRRVPGVVARQEEGGGQRFDVGIRGLDPGRSRRVLVLEDGIPISINPYAEPDLYYAPVIERMRGVEVVKGSGSILFGPQTIGGVVNFLTLAPPNATRAAIDVTGGDYGYLRVFANYGDRTGPVRYVAQVMRKEGDGFRGENFESTDAFGKVAFETGDSGELTLKLGIHDDANVSGDVGFTKGMFERDPRRQTLKPNDHLHLRRYDASITHEQRFDVSTKLTTLAYAYETQRIWRRQSYSRSPASGQIYERIVGDVNVPNDAIYMLRSNTILDRTYDVLGVEPRLEHRFETLGLRHTLEVGARALTETAKYEQRQGDDPTSDAGALLLAEDHRTYAVAAYAHDRVGVGDLLLVSPGLRVEYATFRRHVARQGSVADATDVDQTGDSSSSGVIPGVGTTFGTRKAHLFAGAHVGYAPPRVTSAIDPKGRDQDLKPERNSQYEIGTRLAPFKGLRFETTGYLSLFTNQLIAGTDAGQTLIVNGGATSHYGVEAATQLGIGSVMRLGFDLDLVGTYNFTHATFRGGDYAGNYVPYSPLHTGTIVLDAGHPVGVGAQIAATYTGYQYSDPQNTQADDGTGRVGRIDPFVNLDVGARYKHKASGVTVRLAIKNVLDEVYVQSRRPEGIFPAGYRQIMLGVRYDFAAKEKTEP